MREQRSPAELLVGLKVADDAAVYLVTRDVAIVETLDFFPPIVDDAYASGAIGAANAMSDVYAMGGEVLFVLNIAAWPEVEPLSQRLTPSCTRRPTSPGSDSLGTRTRWRISRASASAFVRAQCRSYPRRANTPRPGSALVGSSGIVPTSTTAHA